MNRKQLIKLIETGENVTVEFKQRFSELAKIAKEIIAFANTKGGTILFGITDNGKIKGVESEKGTVELITETLKNYCEPLVDYKIKYFELNNREIVILQIPESNNKPHRIQDYKKKLELNIASVFVRVNDKSVPASKEMIKLMQTSTNEQRLKKYSIGKNEKLVFEYLNESETITVKKLTQIANLSTRRASRTLINLVRANLLYVHTKDNGENYFTVA
ncbi:MAG: ATP-binding protein [Ignavibacteriae bacterium]|nr:ATP-binding protein [Ignavibacteriota bacterium]